MLVNEEKDSEMDIDGYESSSGDESDRELQIALEKGWLKPGVNYGISVKRPSINNEAGLTSKILQFGKKLNWIERLDVTTKRPNLASDIVDGKGPINNMKDEDDDFQREVSFYKQAQEALKVAMPRLQKLDVVSNRPADYYAEMAKSDKHMTKVREKLLTVQSGKERSESAKRLREERKFASKVQKEVLQNRQTEKKRLLEAVKKHRKGMKEQLEEMLKSADSDNKEVKEDKMKKSKIDSKTNQRRQYKNTKFGFGGQKKRQKHNTAESSAEIGFFGAKNKGTHKGPKGKKRPGKNSRKRK